MKTTLGSYAPPSFLTVAGKELEIGSALAAPGVVKLRLGSGSEPTRHVLQVMPPARKDGFSPRAAACLEPVAVALRVYSNHAVTKLRLHVSALNATTIIGNEIAAVPIMRAATLRL
jgi:hypothetical protein